MYLPGRLSKAQISQGYSLLQKLSNALTEIDELQKQDARGSDESTTTTTSKAATRRSARPKRTSTANASKIRKLKTELKQLSSEFYTLIPHDFGRSLPPAIDTMAEVKLKIDLLEVLVDVEISQKLQREKRKSQRDESAMKVNPLDAQYKVLNVQMEPLAASEEEFQIIDRYVLIFCWRLFMYELEVSSTLNRIGQIRKNHARADPCAVQTQD